MLRRFARETGGATAIEYAVILALVALAAVSFYRMGRADERAASIASKLSQAFETPRNLKCINCGG